MKIKMVLFPTRRTIMKNLILQASLLVGAVLLSTKAFPGTESEIYKCRDGAGHVLLADKPCGIGMTALAMEGEASPADTAQTTPPMPATTPDTTWNTAEPDHAVAAVMIRAPSPGSLLQAKPIRRPLAVDVDTLKQAKLAMLSDDAVWASRRALRD
jgi:hypothetical protein